MANAEQIVDGATRGANGPARPIAYRALAQDLREAIERGDFGRVGQLPTEAQLSKERGVSRQTVRRALQDLVADGLVYRVQGRGTFVSNLPAGRECVQSVSSIEDIEAVPDGVDFEIVEPLHPDIDVEAAGRMRLPSDEVYAGLARRLHAGTIFGVVWFWLPPAVGRLVSQTDYWSKAGAQRHRSLLLTIEQLWPRNIVATQQSVTAEGANEEVAAHLQIEPGTPTLRVDRLFHDTSGDPVELTTSYFNPSRYSYRVTLRRSLDRTRPR
jgi:GntR family transcriptional regulator